MCARAPAQDLVGARQGIENYTHQDPSFAQAREYKFLLAITDAVDANDSETLCVVALTSPFLHERPASVCLRLTSSLSSALPSSSHPTHPP